jgi:hypothetical protein
MSGAPVRDKLMIPEENPAKFAALLVNAPLKRLRDFRPETC